jgi:probable addiction module antidote protein
LKEKTMDLTKTTPYDGSRFRNKKEMALYLDAALEDGDPRIVARALGNIAKAIGMTQIARESGLSREGLYTALSEAGNPKSDTLFKVIKAMGLSLHATEKRVP